MTVVHSPADNARPRYYDLDWLRVFATLAVFLFHAARPFDAGDWHIKNAQMSGALDTGRLLLELWIMPVFFVISGASTALALRGRSPLRFLSDRTLRLLVPLLFGILVIAPPQVYLERLQLGMFSGSFFDFYTSHYFDAPYLGIGEGGNFAWMGLHLWYLEMLFIFSLLLLPLFLWLRTDRMQRALTRVGAWLEQPGVLLLPALPLMFLAAGLDPDGLGMRAFGGWNPLVYLVLMIYGFALASVNVERTFFHYRGLMLAVAVVAYGATFVIDRGPFGTTGYALRSGAFALAMWSLVVLLLGAFYPLRTKTNGLLRYASDLALPFYILHQTVIVVLGYFIVQLDLAPEAKYVVILLTAVPIIVGLYEVVVRRWTPVRFLFGLKPLPRRTADPVSAAEVVPAGGTH